MRTTSTVLFLAVTTFAVKAGEFINLDFEQANTNNLMFLTSDSGIGATKDLLPGWGLAYDETVWGITGFDLKPIYEGPYDTLISAKPFWWPVLGSYAVLLKSSSEPYHLTQPGEIPTDALSIEFAVYGAPWKLEANGVEIPIEYEMYYPGQVQRPRFLLARGDISAFAGMSVQLEFTTVPVSYADFNVIDNIAFSSRAIPEPSTWALLGLGGLGLWWARRQSR